MLDCAIIYIYIYNLFSCQYIYIYILTTKQIKKIIFL